MEVTAIITACISALSAVLVAVLSNSLRKSAKEEEKRSDRRREESMLSLRMMDANCALTIGVAMALKHGHCNGEVEEGLKRVKEAQDKYNEFERRVLAEELAK